VRRQMPWRCGAGSAMSPIDHRIDMLTADLRGQKARACCSALNSHLGANNVAWAEDSAAYHDFAELSVAPPNINAFETIAAVV